MEEERPRHPIRVVAQRTGLTPATLRAWERRYGVVQPRRSEGGQRLYSDRDVERLNRLRELTENGRSISSVAQLEEHEAIALLDEDRASAAPDPGEQSAAVAEPWVERAYALVLSLDGQALEGVLRRAAATLGARIFLDEVAGPLLHRFGSGWVAGEVSPAQEHLGAAVIERVLAWLADPSVGERGPGIVVATLPGERHALGARLVATAAALEGWRVTYLGTDLPVDEIVTAAQRVGASLVALSVVSKDSPDATAREVAALRRSLASAVTVVLGGAGAAGLPVHTLPPGVQVLQSLDDLRRALRARGGPAL